MAAYSKRPLWQWLVIYVVIGAVVYAFGYYFFFAKNGSYSYNSNQSAQSAAVPSSNIYLVKTDPSKGQYLTDFAGVTLYTFDKDTNGVSNCTGACATLWPYYTSGATAQKTFPANISVITDADGTHQQFAWKGMPLYYYAKDEGVGDLTGDGVGGVWHIVKP